MRVALVFAWMLAVVPVATAQEAPPPEGELTAEEEEARSAFTAATRAFEEGRFEYALDRFSHAYELTQRPALLYNVGLTLERLQRPEEALEALEGFLEAVPDTPNRANVEGRIVALRNAVEERRALEAELEAARAARTAEAAEAARQSDADRALAAEPSERAAPARSKWWVWTLVGVVVVGAAVGLAVGLTRDGGVESPIPGDEGAVVSTLRAW